MKATKSLQRDFYQCLLLHQAYLLLSHLHHLGRHIQAENVGSLMTVVTKDNTDMNTNCLQLHNLCNKTHLRFNENELIHIFLRKCLIFYLFSMMIIYSSSIYTQRLDFIEYHTQLKYFIFESKYVISYRVYSKHLCKIISQKNIYNQQDLWQVCINYLTITFASLECE